MKKINRIRMTSPIGVIDVRIKHYKSGEWVGTCKQIPGFLTGGMNSSNEYIYEMVLDCAICIFHSNQIIGDK